MMKSSEPMAVLEPLAGDAALGADAVLELSAFIILMEVLQIKPLAGDAALADPADDEALGAFGVHHPDGSLGAFGHGEPSCRSCRWPVMKLLERMPS